MNHKIIIHNIEQQTEEWYNIRKFKFTASKANTIAVNGKGLITYVKELVSEGLSTGEKEYFSNKHTERGNDLEDVAKNIYELETGNSVDSVGFIEYDKYSGCSPDGLVGEEGGIEIKCLMDSKHFDHIIGEAKIEKSHYAQIQMCLLITGRKWWDYLLFNPNYEKSLIIERIYPDQEFQDKLKEGLREGKQKIIMLKEKYENSVKS